MTTEWPFRRPQPWGGILRRIVSRIGVAFALLAALIWAVTQIPKRAQAQEPPPSPTDVNSSLPPTRPAPVVVASGAQYANVRGLATDAAGGLYISLSTNPAPADCVSSAINTSGATKIPLTIFSNCRLAPAEDPSGIAVASKGNVYLANRAQNAIRLLNMLTGKVSAVPSPRGSRAEAPSASSSLDPFEPAGLAADRDENIYVADRGNNRVLALETGATHFTYLAHVLDAAAVAVDSATGQIYVASPASNRVFVIDLSKNNSVDVFAGTGAFSGTGALLDSAPQNAELGVPEGVAVDGQSNIFISDTDANVIVRVDAKSGTLARIPLKENLSAPAALAIDRAGNVFVADRGNSRVLEFPHLGAPAPAASVTLSPSTFDYGDEPNGGTAPVQQFTLTNNSSSAIALSNASFAFAGANPGDFSETNNCVPSLAAGASCLIHVTFTPGGTGARSATLEVTDSDPSSPQSATVSGTGDDFQLTAASQVATVQNVAPGGKATYSLSVTPDNTFSGTVNLVCPSVFSSGGTLASVNVACSITPQSLSVTPGQPQTFSVTLTTGGPNATRIVGRGPRNGPASPMPMLLLCALLMIGLCGLQLRRAMDRSLTVGAARRARFAAIACALLASAAAGCKYHAPPVNPNETPANSYQLDITGTAQNATRPITLTLNVD